MKKVWLIKLLSKSMQNIGFVAVNRIVVRADYRPRFEELFATRAHAIDRLSGFVSMQVLRPVKPEEPYLVVSQWQDEDSFKAWTASAEFIEGHRRAFADLATAKACGEAPPMQSEFSTYSVLTT
jgi:hypothetical protein